MESRRREVAYGGNVSEKRDRSQRIKSVAANRERSYYTFWTSRDRIAGALADITRVWLRAPIMIRASDGDAYWVASHDDGTSAHFADWTLETCRRQIGTIPDDERQVLKKTYGQLAEPGAKMS